MGGFPALLASFGGEEAGEPHASGRLYLPARRAPCPAVGWGCKCLEAVFDALLKRLDDLAEAYAGGYQRAYDERVRLRQLARQVQLVENHTEWMELSSSSSRSERETWISGLIGRAVYQAPVEVWHVLGEWLAWAEIVQVGKDTVKGNSVVRVGDSLLSY